MRSDSATFNKHSSHIEISIASVVALRPNKSWLDLVGGG
jgi:hypothetical protein